MEGLKDTLIVAGAEAWRALRSARTLLLFGLFGLFTALGLLIAGGGEDESLAELAAADERTRAALLLTLGTLYEQDPALLESFAQLPIGLLVVFKAALFFLPAYLALLGFDQLSAELGSRSIRYLAVRAARSSILLGKFLAQAAVLAALLLAVNVAVFGYAASVNPVFTVDLMLGALFRFTLAGLAFSWVWVALTTLCSALFRSSALSLVTNFLLLFFLLMLSLVSKLGTGMVASLRFASPWTYANGLLHPDPGRAALSVLALAGFVAVFLLAGWATLRARDL